MDLVWRAVHPGHRQREFENKHFLAILPHAGIRADGP